MLYRVPGPKLLGLVFAFGPVLKTRKLRGALRNVLTPSRDPFNHGSSADNPLSMVDRLGPLEFGRFGLYGASFLWIRVSPSLFMVSTAYYPVISGS